VKGAQRTALRNRPLAGAAGRSWSAEVAEGISYGVLVVARCGIGSCPSLGFM